MDPRPQAEEEIALPSDGLDELRFRLESADGGFAMLETNSTSRVGEIPAWEEERPTSSRSLTLGGRAATAVRVDEERSGLGLRRIEHALVKAEPVWLSALADVPVAAPDVFPERRPGSCPPTPLARLLGHFARAACA